MQVTLGQEGLSKTWQRVFEPTTECEKCGCEARIAFVAHEGIDEDPTAARNVCSLHENKKARGGAFWPHDCVAVAVYLCTRCCEAVARWNQA